MVPGAAEQPVLVVIPSGCLVALGVFDANPRRMAAFMWMAVMFLNVAQACHTE